MRACRGAHVTPDDTHQLSHQSTQHVSSTGGTTVRRRLAPWLILAAILSVTIARSPHAVADSTTTASVNSPDGLNLRDGPGTSYNVLAVMPSGTTVTVTGSATADNWLPVQYNGQAGWADGAYLTLASAPTTASTQPGASSSSSSAPPTPPAAVPATSTEFVQPPDGLNLRNGPGTTYGVVTVLPGSASVTVTGAGTTDGWVPVSFNGQSGWVNSSYISSSAPAAAASGSSTLTSNATTASAGAALSAPAGSSATTSAAASGGPVQLAWPGPSRRISTVFSPAHLGVDIDEFPSSGRPLSASAAGTVTFAGGDPCCSYGLHVIIDHGNGMETLYAHLSSIAVKVGQTVAQGQNLGVSGCTGRCTGPHIHFEVHVNGKAVDPLRYLPPPWQIE